MQAEITLFQQNKYICNYIVPSSAKLCILELHYPPLHLRIGLQPRAATNKNSKQAWNLSYKIVAWKWRGGNGSENGREWSTKVTWSQKWKAKHTLGQLRFTAKWIPKQRVQQIESSHSRDQLNSSTSMFSTESSANLIIRSRFTKSVTTSLNSSAYFITCWGRIIFLSRTLRCLFQTSPFLQ